jgi:hypothetical protein
MGSGAQRGQGFMKSLGLPILYSPCGWIRSCVTLVLFFFQAYFWPICSSFLSTFIFNQADLVFLILFFTPLRVFVFAGLDNELFYLDKTMMVFGDAKKIVEDMVKAVD